MSNLLRLERLGLVYPGGTAAVEDVSFSLSAGEIVTLVGPSGCGKSSVLRMIADLESPSKGRVDINPATKLSFVFQDPALMPWATVASNVALPLEIEGVTGDVAAALEKVGLGDRGDAYPAQLSGGMRMRASIARALVRAPGLLLMDEPFAALDELRRFELAEDVRAIASAEDIAVVFVTHSVFEASFVSDRVIVMTPGPGRIAGEVQIDAPGPRTADFRESDTFSMAAAEVSTLLRAAAQAA